MKIQINYELFEKISDAKTGFSLKRLSKCVLLASSVVMLVSGPQYLFGEDPVQNILQRLGESLLFQTSFQGGCHLLLLPPIVKRKALEDLKELTKDLNQINVPTNVDLLQKSYKYDTEYKLNTDSSIPRLQKNTYFMVPIQENGEQREVSLVEEHIVGENSYTISHGSPKKVLKLSLSKAAS